MYLLYFFFFVLYFSKMLLRKNQGVMSDYFRGSCLRLGGQEQRGDNRKEAETGWDGKDMEELAKKTWVEDSRWRGHHV